MNNVKKPLNIIYIFSIIVNKRLDICDFWKTVLKTTMKIIFYQFMTGIVLKRPTGEDNQFKKSKIFFVNHILNNARCETKR